MEPNLHAHSAHFWAPLAKALTTWFGTALALVLFYLSVSLMAVASDSIYAPLWFFWGAFALLTVGPLLATVLAIRAYIRTSRAAHPTAGHR